MILSTGRRPTIIDIARETNRSKTTVSDVLQNKPGYHEATRRLVLEAAARLGYRPDYHGRALRGGRTKSLGVLGFSPGPGCWASQAVARGVEVAARTHGYVSYSAGWGEEDKDKAIQHAQELLHRRVDGIVYYSPVIGPPTQPVEVLIEAKVPVVFVGWAPPTAHYVVRIDRHAAIADLARHLAGLGHRAAVFVSSWFDQENPALKLHTYRETCAAAGLTLDTSADWMLARGSQNARTCYDLVRRQLQAGTMPTVLLTGGDFHAAQALAACHDAGARVPADVSVVGFDDDPLADLLRPSLTTIHVPGEEAGAAAFDLLDHVLRLGHPPAVIPEFRCRLVTRQSTGPARTAILPAR